MIQGKWFEPGKPFDAAEAIRKEVFGRGADELDAWSWNALVLNDGEPAACGRIRWADGAFILEDIAVREPLRGRKLGDLMLRLLLFKAESHGARMIRLVSPAELTGFFARLGFREDEGAEGGSRPMHLRGEDLCLDSCRGCKTPCANRREA